MVLVPRAGAILAERTRAIRSDLANALIVERQFLHPIDGLTLFITDTGRDGEMAGIFLNDQRDPERAGHLLRRAGAAGARGHGGAAGDARRRGAGAGGGSGAQLNAVRFDQFVFDLSDLIRDEGDRGCRGRRSTPVRELLRPTPAMLASGRYTPRRLRRRGRTTS